jgi:hypothetical protein
VPTNTAFPSGSQAGNIQSQIGDVLSQILPQLQAGGYQYGNLASNVGQINAASALQNYYTNQSGSLQQAQNTISGEQIGLQQQGIGNYGQYQQALAGQIAPNQITNKQEMLGLQQNQAQQQWPIQQRNLLGSQMASGALGTQGTQDQYKQLTLSQQQQQAGFSLSEADLQRSQSALDLSAKSNNLSSQQISNSISQALTQSGLNQVLSVSDIANQMAQIQAGGQSAILQALAPILQKYGVNPYATISTTGKGK